MEKLRGLWEAAVRYLRDVRGELRRVVWPDRRQTTVLTAVVLVSSAAVALVIWAFDQLVSWLMRAIMG